MPTFHARDAASLAIFCPSDPLCASIPHDTICYPRCLACSACQRCRRSPASVHRVACSRPSRHRIAPCCGNARPDHCLYSSCLSFLESRSSNPLHVARAKCSRATVPLTQRFEGRKRPRSSRYSPLPPELLPLLPPELLPEPPEPPLPDRPSSIASTMSSTRLTKPMLRSFVSLAVDTDSTDAHQRERRSSAAVHTPHRTASHNARREDGLSAPPSP